LSQPNRIALVTGAARGIGLEIARRLAQQVGAVAIFDVAAGDATELEALPKATRARIERFQVDVADESSVEKGVKEAEKSLGPIDIVVNNAGISPTHGGVGLPIDKTPLDEWSRVLAVNLTGPFLISKHTMPSMKARGWGRIINISSQTARLASSAVAAHYQASKAGIIALTRSTALELGPFGATANCVAPGLTETEMMKDYNFESYAQTVPLRRLGQPYDIANAIAFLVSDEAAYITGAILDINGGRFMP
jgi:3-oxoacyl-[acyl-carrier protein] reductase